MHFQQKRTTGKMQTSLKLGKYILFFLSNVAHFMIRAIVVVVVVAFLFISSSPTPETQKTAAIKTIWAWVMQGKTMKFLEYCIKHIERKLRLSCDSHNKCLPRIQNTYPPNASAKSQMNAVCTV